MGCDWVKDPVSHTLPSIFGKGAVKVYSIFLADGFEYEKPYVEQYSVLVWSLTVAFLVFAFVFYCWLLKRALKGFVRTVDTVGSEIQKSDWYKARKERKEIESMQRKLLKKVLEKQLDER